MKKLWDMVVIGGGIMGCGVAVHLAQAGMRVLVLERGDLGQGASGVNAGTLSLQIKRVKLMPYAIKGHEIWQRMGQSVGFCRTGGFTLAFNDREAALLHERMQLKKEAGAPISFVSPAEVHQREPHLTRRIKAASFCSEDGYANALLTGRYYRQKFDQSGVAYRERTEATAIEKAGKGFRVWTVGDIYEAKRILFACGGWLKQVLTQLNVHLPVRARINTVSVTEPAPRLMSSVMGHATGLLTMKQKANGTVLIGGGWQGKGTPQQGRGRVAMETVVPNLQLASFVCPALKKVRLVRSWTGFEANVPDFYPLAGALPGHTNAFVLGCVRGGYTIGPYIARLMGDLILGKEPEMPLFDPGRDFSKIPET